jgi:hypothetical protein
MRANRRHGGVPPSGMPPSRSYNLLANGGRSLHDI